MSIRACSACVVVGLAAQGLRAAPPVASYTFSGTLNAQESGVAALVGIDPNNVCAFTSDLVFGQTRTVFAVNGVASPVNLQGGLSIPASELVPTNSYSVEMVFLFTDRVNAWRRILDVEGRQSDNGFYVDPSNHLDVYPILGSSAAWSNGVYHHVVLTVSGGLLSSYLDGAVQFNSPSTLMDRHPNVPMVLFADNVVAGGQGEWSPARIALLRLYATPLTANDVATLAANPFAGLPECAADFNGDGFLDIYDFTDFVTCFEDGVCPPGATADFNHDGFPDIFDFNDFVTAFEIGC